MADGSYFLYAQFAGSFRGDKHPTDATSCDVVDIPAKSRCVIALTSSDEDGSSPPDCVPGRVNHTTCIVMANAPEDKHGAPYKARDFLKNRGRRTTLGQI